MPDNPSGGDGPFDHGHPRPEGSNGVRPRGVDVRPVPFEEIEDPIDLVAVQADDELINALAAGMSVSSPGVGGYDADDRVAAILAAWKADVDAEPIPELVDLDTAVSAVKAARPPVRRTRYLAPVAAAAAFLVLAIGGLSVGSYDAQPEDMLWPVSRVLYSERAESVEAAVRVEEHIANAKEALFAGEPVVAARELERAEADLANVRPEEGRTELAETQDFLVAKAAETPQGQPTNPGTPLATQPSRPVPPGAASPSPDGSTSPTGSTDVSGTSVPGRPGPSGTTDRPDGSSTTADPRRAAVAPESGTSSASATPTPDPSRGGEGGPDDADQTRSPEPTATTEGGSDEPTTSPETSQSTAPSSGGTSGTTEGASGPPSSGGTSGTTEGASGPSPDDSSGSAGSTTASGSGEQPTSN